MWPDFMTIDERKKMDFPFYVEEDICVGTEGIYAARHLKKLHVI